MPNSAAVSVRRLRGDDHEKWRALWGSYLSFYRAQVPDEVSELTFMRLRDGEQGMLGLVAVDPDDQPIALAHLVCHPATWSATGYCYLEDLYVDRSHRGGQITETIFEAVYAQARERGIQRVYWHTQQFNVPRDRCTTRSAS
jgi:GNAT superfamily N-acetyltransferase